LCVDLTWYFITNRKKGRGTIISLSQKGKTGKDFEGKWGLIVHTYNLSTREAEAGGSQN
jgi:hypothetical protein